MKVLPADAARGGVSAALCVVGLVPDGYLRMSDLVFSQVILRHTVTYDGPLVGEDNFGEEPQPQLHP